MKKNFKFYALIWTIVLAVFNVIVFLVRRFIPGQSGFDALFWVAWAFIVIAFVGNLVCAYFTFKAENLKRMFYRLPLVTIGWSTLFVMLVVSIIFMVIPNCPAWIATIVCVLILAFYAISVIKAIWVADTVERVDEKVKTQTNFIKNLTIDAERLLAYAKTDTVKAECKKVYESVRYSDPISNDDLSVIEAKITVKMDEFASAVGSNDVRNVKDIAGELIILVNKRNKECKRLKQ